MAYGGGSKRYASLAPGATHTQTTFSKAYWLVTDSKGAPLGYFKTTDKIGIAVIPEG